jgi:Archaeal/vacuolar-type H+-ATPase subunit C
MKETAYTFAVSKLRVIETRLLNNSDLEQLINAPDYDSAVRMLRDKGFIGDKDDIVNSLKDQMTETWKLLTDITPDKESLEFLVVKNDFHNLKAALKAFVTQNEDSDYYILPSLVSPELVKSAVMNKKFSELPGYLRAAAEKTYDVLVRTMDGQLTDIMLDAMTLNNMNERALSSGNPYIIKLAELYCVTANIKTAYRAARTGKDELFLAAALCDTSAIYKTALIQAARKGTDDLLSFLMDSSYKEAAEALKISLTAFEKWCDDVIMDHIGSAKYKSFGVEPLIAYYIAKETEVKTVRIILSCKRNGLDSGAIRERVRKLYV